MEEESNILNSRSIPEAHNLFNYQQVSSNNNNNDENEINHGKLEKEEDSQEAISRKLMNIIEVLSSNFTQTLSSLASLKVEFRKQEFQRQQEIIWKEIQEGEPKNSTYLFEGKSWRNYMGAFATSLLYYKREDESNRKFIESSDIFLTYKEKYRFHLLRNVSECFGLKCHLNRYDFPTIRVKFEWTILAEASSRLSKSEKIVYTSLGSDLLLQDLIILTRMIEEGFSQLEVHFVDSLYLEWIRRIKELITNKNEINGVRATPSVKLPNSCFQKEESSTCTIYPCINLTNKHESNNSTTNSEQTNAINFLCVNDAIYQFYEWFEFYTSTSKKLNHFRLFIHGSIDHYQAYCDQHHIQSDIIVTADCTETLEYWNYLLKWNSKLLTSSPRGFAVGLTTMKITPYHAVQVLYSPLEKDVSELKKAMYIFKLFSFCKTYFFENK